jgi:hypothetical protein
MFGKPMWSFINLRILKYLSKYFFIERKCYNILERLTLKKYMLTILRIKKLWTWSLKDSYGIYIS